MVSIAEVAEEHTDGRFLRQLIDDDTLERESEDDHMLDKRLLISFIHDIRYIGMDGTRSR